MDAHQGPAETQPTGDVWSVRWAHGEFKIHARGGMLGSTQFRLADGRSVRPFYEAPWLGESGPVVPELLAGMRNEFSCAPFGGAYQSDGLPPDWRAAAESEVLDVDAPLMESDLLLHGYGGAHDWQLNSRSEGTVHIAIDYPDTSPIRRITRTVAADRDAAAINFSVTIEARRTCRRPIGVHPNIALPELAGALHIKPAGFEFGMVHPFGPEKGVSRAAPGALFSDLAKVPMHAGGAARFDRLPFAHDTEETLELCGCDGRVEIVDTEAQARYRLSWDASVLPSLLLWISNRGRAYAPWNSRNLCVGVEPLAGAFDLGSRAGIADNPINRRGVKTAVKLDPGQPLTFSYRFEADTMRESDPT